MLRFLLIISCLVIAGAVSDGERVEVKSGENVTLRVEKPGLGKARLVTLQKNCENGTENDIYCSPEEEMSGCTAKKSEKLSFIMDGDSFSVILVDVTASDEGCYAVSHVDFTNIVTTQKFIVKINVLCKCTDTTLTLNGMATRGPELKPVKEREAAVPSQDPASNVGEDVSQKQLPSTINPELPSINPFSTPALTTKSEETFETDGPTATVSTGRNGKISLGIKVFIIGVLIAVIIGIICYKKASVITDLNKNSPFLQSAGEPGTDESLEIVVETNSSAYNEEGPLPGA
ncbi:DNA-directed RNA polymerase II subunit rpb1 [Labeo rohita]|uniref:DNA-directed RNA polymerase II subunit rpb1 n=1 Tax=Labeo rohita TaxID=84645 RepID=A0ABQ8LFF4_LABRO|nr:DNA-directed RNA polymerase II subunit rpb1 [Labeo rohita]